MTTHGGKRPNSGPKTKASKGLEKYKQLSVTIPPHTHNSLKQIYIELRITNSNLTLSEFVTELIESSLAELL